MILTFLKVEKLGEVKIMNKIYIVAEIGCNHNGDVELAYKMVDEANKCGVDAVKFQTFNSELLISKSAPKAEYQIKTTGANESQLEMTRKLELSQTDYLKLKDYAESLGLDVFSTGFDDESIDFLHKNGQSVWKIPSGEVTNYPYLRKIANFDQDKKKIILSTGMASLEEIKKAVDILDQSKNTELIILHCNTEYPTEDCDVNVSAIKDLHEKFPNYHIGFSDHSRGFVAPILAVAYDIVFIEKHFTLDNNMEGPDHKASIMPEDLKILCESVRRAEVMNGDGKKRVTPSEEKNKKIARKSIIAKRKINIGDIFTEDNLICKRPGNGISPIYWDDLIGRKSESNFQEDELIIDSRFEWEEK